MTPPHNDLTAQASAPSDGQPAPQPAPSSAPEHLAQSLATSPAQPGQPAISFAEDPRATALVPTSPLERTGIPTFLQTLNSQLSTLNSHRPRNGKIAQLPRLEREIVNRMLRNNVPQEKIVAALAECGFHVTQRNVSNWKTHGGYKEWCAAQNHALELRTFQDNLTDFLRRHDAAELPEVGLQSAATSLSAILLRPDLMPELLASPEKYSKLIELQCRLAREIQALQKNRDAASKSVGINPERQKREDENNVEIFREVYSSKSGGSPRNPDIPHRNFIPKEIEPFVRVPDPSEMRDALRIPQAHLARLASLAHPTPKPESPR